MAKKAKAAEAKPKKNIAPPVTAKPAAKSAPKKAAAKPAPARSPGKKAPPVTPTPPQGKTHASLDEARSATIDALLATIEDAEQRLFAAKRATSIEELDTLRNGR